MKKYLIIALLLCFSLALSGHSGCNQAGKNVPEELKTYAKEWAHPNKDYSNTRATTDSAINASNVKSLGLEWSFAMPYSGAWGAAATNPVVQNGLVYVQDLMSNVFCFELATGKLKWKKEYMLSNIGPNGVFVAYGKVFCTKGPQSVAALDMNGTELWSTKIAEKLTEGIDIAPVAYGNHVFVSTVPGSSNENFYTGGVGGVLFALDQETGKPTWTFKTVDSENLWGNPKVNSGGGAWYPAAIDDANGTMYWAIANPAPWPGTKEFPNGSSRPGNNLYTNSLVALDHEDGKMHWYKQVVPHDLFDFDFHVSPILAEIEIGGKKVEVIIGAGKMGKVFCFERETGNILWTTPVGKHENDELKELPANKITRVYPGPLGGVETPMAFADGVIYVAVDNLFGDYQPDKFIGSTFNIAKGTGELVAIKALSGEILWKVDLPSLNVGAATVVNDIVFTATNDGTIYAFGKKDGSRLWHYKTPSGINGWPAVAGDMIVWPAGFGGTPTLLAFKLGTKPKGPSIKITKPDITKPVNEGAIEVYVDVGEFLLVNKMGQPKVAGEGHIHYYLDVTPPTAPGKPSVTAKGTFVPSVEKEYAWKNVKPGKHTFYAQLVNNDHTPLEPPVVASLEVNVVKKGTPAKDPAKGFNLAVEANSMAFNVSEIVVPSDTKIIVTFKNLDTGIPHNFAVYKDASMKDKIFVGKIIRGVDTVTEEFISPKETGVYYFQCDIHRSLMNGKFIVK